MLHARNAIVTGVRRGIGRAIGELFAANGASIIARTRRVDPEFVTTCRDLSARHRVDVTPVQIDLADAQSIQTAVKSIHALGCRIDVLVNNAGAATGGTFSLTSPQSWRENFEVNLFGPIQFTQGIARLMARKGGGSIVNIASTAAFVADPGTAVYGSSKCALVRATHSLAIELAAQGIRVNAIAPGPTRTDMLEQMDPNALRGLLDRSAAKRPAEPEEIASVALFFASDLSRFVNGQTLRVDGGMA